MMKLFGVKRGSERVKRCERKDERRERRMKGVGKSFERGVRGWKTSKKIGIWIQGVVGGVKGLVAEVKNREMGIKKRGQDVNSWKRE